MGVTARLRGLGAKRRTLLALVVGGYLAGTHVGRRRGYNFGGDVVVRCRSGHLFTTIWVPGASLKAVGSAGPASSAARSVRTGAS